MRSWSLCSAAFLLASCTRSAAPAPPAGPPPAGPPAAPVAEGAAPLDLTWHGTRLHHAGKVVAELHPPLWGRPPLAGILVAYVTLPRGTRVQVGGGAPFTLDDEALALEVDLVDALASVPVDQQAPAVTPRTALTISLPDGRRGQVHLPPITPGEGWQDAIAARVASAGLRFPDEPADPAPRDSLFYAASYYGGTVYGRAGTWAQLDFVAVRRKMPAIRTLSCPREVDGKLTQVPLEIAPFAVVIHDRRTGAVVDRREFEPLDVACPVYSPDPAAALPVSWSGDPVDAWLAAWL